MNGECRGPTPSWLTLELYELGELSGDERRAVEEHLQACEVCSTCLEEIRGGAELAPLQPVAGPARRPSRARLAWAVAVSAVFAAAMLVFWLGGAGRESLFEGAPSRSIAYKGGELSMTLVRERAGIVRQDPGTFAAGDRFKVEVTCPPGKGLHWELAIFDAEGVSFPLHPAGRLVCGNRVPLPGAFGLTSRSAVLVCLLTDDEPIDRRAIAEGLASALPEHTVCTVLALGE